MAATITVSAPVLASDGKVFTCTLAGGTAPYSITNVTNISVHGTDGWSYQVGTPSISGTTLTLPLLTAGGSGETIKLDVTASATISDSAANTPTGQTNIAVTNNSAIVVTMVQLSNAGNLAQMELNAIPAFAGLNNRQVYSGGTTYTNSIADWFVEIVTDATTIDASGYYAANLIYSIDGGATQTVAASSVPGFTGYTNMATGLAAGKHLVRVKLASFFNGFRLTGGTRSLFTVPTTKVTIGGATLGAVNPPNATPVSLWGSYATPGTDGTVSTGSYGALGYDVAFSGTGVESAQVANTGTNAAVSIDGAQPGQLVTTGDATTNNNSEYVPLVGGLTDATHQLRVYTPGSPNTLRALRVVRGSVTAAASSIGDTTLSVASIANISAGDWLRLDKFSTREVAQVSTIAGTGPYTLTLSAALTKAHASGITVTSYSAPAGSFAAPTTPLTFTKRVVGMGDSNTQGANPYGFANTPDTNGNYYLPYDTRLSYLYQFALGLGWEPVNVGIQGTDTVNQAGRKADINTYSRSSFNYLIIWEGVNDINSNTVTPTQYSTNVQAQIDIAAPNLRTGGKIYLMPPATPQGATSAKGLSISVCQTQLQALAANSANYTGTGVYNGQPYSSFVVYVSTAFTGVNLTVYDATTNPTGEIDGALHYRPSGQTKIANNIKALFVLKTLFPSSFSLLGVGL